MVAADMLMMLNLVVMIDQSKQLVTMVVLGMMTMVLLGMMTMDRDWNRFRRGHDCNHLFRCNSRHYYSHHYYLYTVMMMVV